MKKGTTISLCTIMAIMFLAGCNKNNIMVEKYAGIMEKGANKTVSMMAWYSEDEMEGVVDAINRQLDGEYTVEYTYVSRNDYNNVLSTQLAAGEGPDIIADGANFPARIEAGVLKDITGSERLKGFDNRGMFLSTKDRRIYGIPSYGWFSGIYYNRDVFEKNGISQIPRTLDELIEVCDWLSARGVQPFSMGLSDGNGAFHLLFGYLENVFFQASEEGKQFDVDFIFGRARMDGTLNSFVEEWMELVRKGYINKIMCGISESQARAEFCSGKTAMIISGPWDFQDYVDSGLKIGMMPFVGKSPDLCIMHGGPAANYGINVNAMNKEGAEKVLDALASVEVQQAFVSANTGSFSYRHGVSAVMPEEYDNVRDIISSGHVVCCWYRWAFGMPSQLMVDKAIS